MAVEEQTTNNTDMLLATTWRKRIGQKLTISDRTVTKLAFLLKKVGAVTGDLTYTIRKVSDDSIIVSKVWGDASALQTSLTWEEATFDAPTYVNEAVYIAAEFGELDGDKHIVFRYQNTNVKADELMAYYPSDSWTENATWDAAYRYTYGVVELENKSAGMAAKMLAGKMI